jgi:hypothetical protein
MWSARRESVGNGRIIKVAVEQNSSSLSFSRVLSMWRIDADFRSFFNTLLADAPFTAFRWETPPISIATADRPFEFVLLDSPGLAGNPDASAFAEHFRGKDKSESVLSFPNLGSDAILVVPRPGDSLSAYGHIAAFVRLAPDMQRHSLWELVGQEMERRLNDAPVWLSTAGAGVSWLHVRLDDRPKYYGYRPYQDPN